MAKQFCPNFGRRRGAAVVGVVGEDAAVGVRARLGRHVEAVTARKTDLRNIFVQDFQRSKMHKQFLILCCLFKRNRRVDTYLIGNFLQSFIHKRNS
jgi:hypothetical protein